MTSLWLICAMMSGDLGPELFPAQCAISGALAAFPKSPLAGGKPSAHRYQATTHGAGASIETYEFRAILPPGHLDRPSLARCGPGLPAQRVSWDLCDGRAFNGEFSMRWLQCRRIVVY
jgi:hypothetical protein